MTMLSLLLMKVHLNIVPKKDKPISEVISDLMKKNSKIGKGYLNKRIKLLWKESMGPTINSYTKSIYLSRKQLFINITSAPLRQELSMSKDKIRNLINQGIGKEVVEEVIIR